ncbi:MAG: hypothetical protein LC114_27195 [Bryobacterales bacterium]|nr:hypothetical protein [Bryobacterales bacterium]
MERVSHASGLRIFAAILILAGLSRCVFAQAGPAERGAHDAWVPFGNTTILAGVAGASTGPVERVWFDSASPAVELPNNSIYVRREEGEWTFLKSVSAPPRLPNALPLSKPTDARIILEHPLARARLYALGSQIYRSEDGGAHWTGLTRYRGFSILGDELRDLALNPLDPDDLLVASELGVWRSRDGGLSWANAGDGLPNFPALRILRFPQGVRGLAVETTDHRILEWVPGAAHGWRIAGTAALVEENRIPESVRSLGFSISAWDAHGAAVYAGRKDGTLLASLDGGESWRAYSQTGLKSVRSLHANPEDERMALAVVELDSGKLRLLRTLNGGAFWDDWTPLDAATETWDAAAPSFAQQTLFLVTGGVVHRYNVDFRAMSRPDRGAGFRVEGLPSRVLDLRLDPSGTLLFAIAESRGVFSVEAPGFPLDPLVRNVADLGSGPTAPGALLSIHSEPFARLRANGIDSAILGMRSGSTQIQLPYGITSSRVELSLEGAGGKTRTVAVPLRPVQPSIFLNPDGNPLVVHSANGLFMDENNPLTPGSRFQVMLTGLGTVSPEWPVGMAAPLTNPPVVLAAVEAFANGLRLPVLSATLAPGYAGIYLVEAELTMIMDEGIAELRIVVNGTATNPVAIHIAY